MRSYEVTAEFYDLLHAAKYLHRTRALLDRWLGNPNVGVLDVGAGTGLGTDLLARRCSVMVHAVEPARSMRAVLLSRLAAEADLLPRVRVHAKPVQQLGLRDVADFALCLNTMATLDVGERSTVLNALAVALVPGGRLVVECPPARADETTAPLASCRIGGEVFSGEVACLRISDEVVQWRFTYRVLDGERVVRQERESFDGFLVSPDDFGRELDVAGLEVIDRDADDVVLTRLARTAGGRHPSQSQRIARA